MLERRCRVEEIDLAVVLQPFCTVVRDEGCVISQIRKRELQILTKGYHLLKTSLSTKHFFHDLSHLDLREMAIDWSHMDGDGNRLIAKHLVPLNRE